MTPIERAANALIAEIQRQGVTTLPNLWDDGAGCEETGTLRLDGKIELAPLVRAVIVAIREPSEAAESAFEYGKYHAAKDDRRPPFTRAWTAAIDALLAEEDQVCS